MIKNFRDLYKQTEALLSPVATGGFWGLSPPNQAPSPSKWEHETL